MARVIEEWIRRFVGRLLVIPRLFKKRAQKKKMECADLQQADYQIGKAAYEENVRPEVCPVIRSNIAEVKRQIEILSNPTEAEAILFVEKAKAAFLAATRRTKIFALTLQQKRLLTHLGTNLRLESSTDSPTTPECAAGQQVTENIRKLDSEIESLSSQTFAWSRYPVLVTILVTLFIVWINNGPGGRGRNSTSFTGHSGNISQDVDAMRGLGLLDGANWAQQYGRRPSKAELAKIIQQRMPGVPKTEQEREMIRAFVDAFTSGFEEGCNHTLRANRPAF